MVNFMIAASLVNISDLSIVHPLSKNYFFLLHGEVSNPEDFKKLVKKNLLSSNYQKSIDLASCYGNSEKFISENITNILEDTPFSQNFFYFFVNIENLPENFIVSKHYLENKMITFNCFYIRKKNEMRTKMIENCKKIEVNFHNTELCALKFPFLITIINKSTNENRNVYVVPKRFRFLDNNLILDVSICDEKNEKRNLIDNIKKYSRNFVDYVKHLFLK